MKRTQLLLPILLGGLIVASVVYAAAGPAGPAGSEIEGAAGARGVRDAGDVGEVGGVRDLEMRRMEKARELHAREIDRAAADFNKRVARANAVLQRTYEPIIKSYERSDEQIAAQLRTELAGVCDEALALVPMTEPMHVALIESIGQGLVAARGRSVASDELGGRDYVLLYFTAEWCGPCKRFTPQLAKFYADNREAGNFEVVVVSSDRNEDAFTRYLGSMPWVAVPFARRDACGLKKQYGGRGIPHLVLLDGAGEVLSSSYEGTRYVGPQKVLSDFEAILASN